MAVDKSAMKGKKRRDDLRQDATAQIPRGWGFLFSKVIGRVRATPGIDVVLTSISLKDLSLGVCQVGA